MDLAVRITATFTVESNDSRESLQEHVLEVADHLHDLDDIHDQSISVDLRERKVAFDVSAYGATYGAAVDVGWSSIRTAIHAAGGNTPNWPTIDEAFPELRSETHGTWAPLPDETYATLVSA